VAWQRSSITLAVLCLHVRLDVAALRLLANVKGAAVFADVLADVEPKGLAGAEWAASC